MADPTTLRTACGPQALAAIADALKAAWSANAWIPEPIRRQIDIAVAEIAANIVEHAGRIQAATVEMRMEIFPDHVEVAFTDTGVEADIDLDDVRMPGELAEGGRGLAIAKAVLDRVAYHRSELGNQWTLISRSFRAS